MKLDDVKKLHQKKYRNQFGYYLVEGEHLILELQRASKTRGEFQDVTLYATAEYEEWIEQLDTHFVISIVSKKQMAQLSDTKTPQGVIACVPLPRALGNNVHSLPQQNERCVYLHEVQDPGNLGTIMRTLAWFGKFRLLLSANSVDPFNSKVVRASMGAIFHLPVEMDVEIRDLPKRFNNIAYLDMQGVKVNTPEFNNYECYLFGNEARGVPLEALSAFNAKAFTIGGCGVIDSLNLASAVNICAYQLSV